MKGKKEKGVSRKSKEDETGEGEGKRGGKRGRKSKREASNRRKEVEENRERRQSR